MARIHVNAKIVYEDGWAAANKNSADDDYWGVKDMNACCGKVDVPIPSDLVAGDYLLRAEVIALHTAGSSGGAQFYMSCCKSTHIYLGCPHSSSLRSTNRHWRRNKFSCDGKISRRVQSFRCRNSCEHPCKGCSVCRPRTSGHQGRYNGRSWNGSRLQEQRCEDDQGYQQPFCLDSRVA